MASEKQLALDEVHRRLGRNILLFQLIEWRLKLLVPLIHHKPAKHCFDRFRARMATAKRQTLGQLLGRFNEVVHSDWDGFSAYLADVAGQRNELVHHIHTKPNLNLTTIDGCKVAATFLAEQFEEIKQFNALTDNLLVSVMEVLRDFTFNDTSEREAFAKLCDQARERLVD